MKRFLLTFVFLVPLILSGNALSKGAEVLHYTIDYPPYFEGSSNNFKGPYVAILDAIYSRAGLNVKMKNVPYARIHKFMLPKEVAIVVYGANAETDHKLLYPIPKTTITLTIAGLNKEPDINLESLKDKRIAIQRGYPLGNFEQIRNNPDYETISTNSVAQALKLLQLERVDFIVTLDGPFEKEVKKLKLDGKQLWSQTIEKMEGWPIAIVKEHPLAEELHRSIKSAYEELVSEGVLGYDNREMFFNNRFAHGLSQQ